MERDNYLDFTNLFLSLNTLLQITVYCTFAETLTQKTISIPDAIYASEWINKNQQFKVCVQILIIRLQKPFYFTAYGFFAITHQRLTQIVNTTLSYYMMLQTTS